MKVTRCPLVLLTLLAAPLAHAFIVESAAYVNTSSNWQSFVGNTGSEAWSDSTINPSTVKLTLSANWLLRRWELRVHMAQSGSENLTENADVTLNRKLRVNLFTYPVGDAQYGRGYYFHGQNMTDFDYNPTQNTLSAEFEPVVPVDSLSVTGAQWNAAAGLDIYFRGTPQDPSEIDHGPPVVLGDMICTDVDRAMHASSALLRGKAFSFNGIDGSPATIRFILGSRHAAAKGYDLQSIQGFVDGTQPSTGFEYTVSAPTFPIGLGDPLETFGEGVVINSDWSTRDIQVGQFPQPLEFTGITREPGGVRLTWNAEAGKTYTLQYFDVLGGSPDTLATGLTGPDHLDTDGGNSERFYRLLEE